MYKDYKVGNEKKDKRKGKLFKWSEKKNRVKKINNSFIKFLIFYQDKWPAVFSESVESILQERSFIYLYTNSSTRRSPGWNKTIA